MHKNPSYTSVNKYYIRIITGGKVANLIDFDRVRCRAMEGIVFRAIYRLRAVNVINVAGYAVNGSLSSILFTTSLFY